MKAAAAVLETTLIEKNLFPPMEEFWKDRKKLMKSMRKMNSSLSSGNLRLVKSLVEELDIKCPVSGTNNWTDVRQFNLMFKTQMGATADASSDLYLRPETAQGIFC